MSFWICADVLGVGEGEEFVPAQVVNLLFRLVGPLARVGVLFTSLVLAFSGLDMDLVRGAGLQAA